MSYYYEDSRISATASFRDTFTICALEAIHPQLTKEWNNTRISLFLSTIPSAAPLRYKGVKIYNSLCLSDPENSKIPRPLPAELHDIGDKFILLDKKMENTANIYKRYIGQALSMITSIGCLKFYLLPTLIKQVSTTDRGEQFLREIRFHDEPTIIPSDHSIKMFKTRTALLEEQIVRDIFICKIGA